jgi:hypothetical protein
VSYYYELSIESLGTLKCDEFQHNLLTCSVVYSEFTLLYFDFLHYFTDSSRMKTRLGT